MSYPTKPYQTRTPAPRPAPVAPKGNANSFKWSKYEKFLVGEYFKDGQEFVLTIRAVVEQSVFSQREQKEISAPVLYFAECAQGLPITITANRRALARWFGDVATNAVGHKVKLQAKRIKVAGSWKTPLYLVAQVDGTTGNVVSDPLFKEPTVEPGDEVPVASESAPQVSDPTGALAEA